ncbi:SH3 domain-containing C40 family peptidase [Paenibacillus thalictri]|uniref:Hydrolase Nlp/P60 n=1 Tax=Paenibacillus thalictri TaxID=2527873 RepID=A0A4Q9DDX3_9BACL|nr:SH3 domain-containing C40 family peptidase [Paenibacillus thalictri]TBL67913.1 hydrolase Nlp/P60 [Paenibacillus thalictri]
MKRQLLTVMLSAALFATLVPVQAMAAYTVSIPMAKVVKTVNFRDQPSTSGNQIRYLKVGETLSVLSVPNGSWLQVKDSSGQTGYVSSLTTYIQQYTENEQPPANAKIVKSVNFRTGPSTDAAKIRLLSKGESLWILEKINSYWYKAADTNNTIGYVSTGSEYIDTDFDGGAAPQPAPEPEPEPEVEPVEQTFISPPNATAVSSVSFRTGPSTDASRIRYVSKGEKLLILNKTNSYWYYVQDESGALGYVSTGSQYISTTYVEPYKLLDPATAAQKAIETGMKYLGTPYEFGSSRSDTSTFDCSDFVRQAYLDGIGQLLPGDSRSQASYVKGIGKTKTDWRQLKKGDLMFFMSYKGSTSAAYANVDRANETVTHVGIYLGDGQVLHTYSISSGGVRVDSVADSQWEMRFLFGGSTY